MHLERDPRPVSVQSFPDHRVQICYSLILLETEQPLQFTKVHYTVKKLSCVWAIFYIITRTQFHAAALVCKLLFIAVYWVHAGKIHT
jgi:hypothetical protein